MAALRRAASRPPAVWRPASVEAPLLLEVLAVAPRWPRGQARGQRTVAAQRVAVKMEGSVARGVVSEPAAAEATVAVTAAVATAAVKAVAARAAATAEVARAAARAEARVAAATAAARV